MEDELLFGVIGVGVGVGGKLVSWDEMGREEKW